MRPPNKTHALAQEWAVWSKTIWDLRLEKETVDQTSTPLAHVFNMSLQEGSVPLEWKEANIIPVFKRGSRNKSVNYRPVGLTSVICKLLETIIRDHNLLWTFS